MATLLECISSRALLIFSCNSSTCLFFGGMAASCQHILQQMAAHDNTSDVWRSTWQYVETHSNTWQHKAIRGSTWQYVATHENTWRHVAARGSVAARGNTWQHVATRGNTWKDTAVHGNTWQHPGTVCTVCTVCTVLYSSMSMFAQTLLTARRRHHSCLNTSNYVNTNYDTYR